MKNNYIEGAFEMKDNSGSLVTLTTLTTPDWTGVANCLGKKVEEVREDIVTVCFHDGESPSTLFSMACFNPLEWEKFKKLGDMILSLNSEKSARCDEQEKADSMPKAYQCKRCGDVRPDGETPLMFNNQPICLECCQKATVAEIDGKTNLTEECPVCYGEMSASGSGVYDCVECGFEVRDFEIHFAGNKIDDTTFPREERFKL